MSDAIISRRGYTSAGKPELRTEIIAFSQDWTVPNTIKGNTAVRIFGGGGGSVSCGGGSGWMNNGEFALNAGDVITVTIGDGGYNNNAGGSTSFGTYLSANGGSPGQDWSGGSGGAGGGTSGASGSGIYGGTGYQFGGGGSGQYGGDGGIWGGGGYGKSNTRSKGGAGNGGTYGGGGGSTLYTTNNNVGRGGSYGGNGASVDWSSTYKHTFIRNAVNGTNTWGNGSVPQDCWGYGLAGTTGAKNTYDADDGWTNTLYPGGGGGFGGNGGSNDGGGGGYGGDGGSNRGGGGGYGRTAKGGNNGGGGGGWYGCGCDGGGGGGYGNASKTATPGFAAGGSSGYPGGKGVCILQYYA